MKVALDVVPLSKEIDKPLPSYTSIINSLLRIMPGGSAAENYKTVARLHPRSEDFVDHALAQQHLNDHANSWMTRHAYEACRGFQWPFWLNAQTNPKSPTFLNASLLPVLTNQVARDAVAIPGLNDIFAGTFDRRGMITPPRGRFSIEFWFRFGDEIIYPSEILWEDDINFDSAQSIVGFACNTNGRNLRICVGAEQNDDLTYLRINAQCDSGDFDDKRPVSIYMSIRPYNTESVVPLHDLVYNSKGFWMSNSRIIAWFPRRPDISWASNADHDDAANFIIHPPERTAVRCPAGMATAVSGFHFPPEYSAPIDITVRVPLQPALPRRFPFPELTQIKSNSDRNDDSPASLCAGKADTTDQTLFQSGIQQLQSMMDIRSSEVQQQLRYRNHWIVAATRAQLKQDQTTPASRLLKYCALSVQKNGYMDIAAGKWGFQGQFLTALADYYRTTGSRADSSILRYSQIRTIGRWIMRKRREVAHAPDKPTGLLPPGVTRDGVGMEYQLADNLWALEGLESAAWLARFFNEHSDAEIFRKDADKYARRINAAIHRELEYGLSQQVPGRLHRAFDPVAAAELLDIALMDEARALLKPQDWLRSLIDLLIEPLDENATTKSPVTIRQMDQRGVFPARRLMLCHAMRAIDHSQLALLTDEAKNLATPQHTWTECLNPATRMGTGRSGIDVEAAALYVSLAQ